jgi:hypothetical protein
VQAAAEAADKIEVSRKGINPLSTFPLMQMKRPYRANGMGVLLYAGVSFREKKPRQSPVFFIILNFRNFSHTPFHCAHIEIPKMRLRARVCAPKASLV